MISKLVSIKVIISKVVRDLDLTDREIPVQDIIEWIASANLFIGAFPQMEQKTAEIEIEDFKGELPCDHYKTISIIDGCYVARYDGNLIGDTQEELDIRPLSNRTFNTNLNTITTSFQTGKIRINYLAVPVDDCGLPMIADDVSYHEAIFYYVAMKLALLDKIRSKHYSPEFCRYNWNNYCVQARANANMPDTTYLDNLVNRWSNLRYNHQAYNSWVNTL